MTSPRMGGPDYDDFELEFGFEDGIESGHTVVPNRFIIHFMPKAPGNFVKIYLAGLMRCFGHRNSQYVSVKTLAEEQGISVRVVQRAWAYWEERGLIRRVPRYLRDPKNPRDYKLEPDSEYKYQTSNLIVFRDRRHWILDDDAGDNGGTIDVPPAEQENRTDVGMGVNFDTRGGVSSDTRGGVNFDTLRNTNTEEYKSERVKEEGGVDQAFQEQAATLDLPLTVSSEVLPHDELGIDYEPIVAAARRAGILMFDGQLRLACELAAIRGMDEKVIAACIDDAKALEAQKSPRTPMWKWAQAFVRSAFEAGVRTLEDYQRFKEQKAKEARMSGREPMGGRRSKGWYSSKPGEIQIDWSKWGQPGNDGIEG